MVSVLYNGEIYLDPIITEVTWSGDITQAFRTLSLSLKNTLDGVSQAVSIELGGELRLLNEDESELFRGVIFSHEIDAKGEMRVTAYDENVYLVKNSDSRKFSGTTASSVVRQLCADFGISVGAIADTDYVIPRLIFRDKTLWTMMVTALTETTRQTGRRFWIYARNGNLNLIERGEKRVDWVIENGVNLTDASYSLSIEEMRNSVKVIANEDAKPEETANLPQEALDMIGSGATVAKSSKSPIVATARDDTLITKYGLMQQVERLSVEATQSRAEQLAQETLKELAKVKDEARVEALGNVEVTAGTAVYVIESMTAIVGGFYVITDSHTWSSNGTHRMALTVSGDESLPTLRYEELDDALTERTSKKKSTGLSEADAAALARL